METPVAPELDTLHVGENEGLAPDFKTEESVPESVDSTSEDAGLEPNENTENVTIEEAACRICSCEETEDEPLFCPCQCTGSIMFIHETCLKDWLVRKNSDLKLATCEVCGSPYTWLPVYKTGAPDTVPIWRVATSKKVIVHCIRHILVSLFTVPYNALRYLVTLRFVYYTAPQYLAVALGGPMFNPAEFPLILSFVWEMFRIKFLQGLSTGGALTAKPTSFSFGYSGPSPLRQVGKLVSAPSVIKETLQNPASFSFTGQIDEQGYIYLIALMFAAHRILLFSSKLGSNAAYVARMRAVSGAPPPLYPAPQSFWKFYHRELYDYGEKLWLMDLIGSAASLRAMWLFWYISLPQVFSVILFLYVPRSIQRFQPRAGIHLAIGYLIIDLYAASKLYYYRNRYALASAETRQSLANLVERRALIKLSFMYILREAGPAFICGISVIGVFSSLHIDIVGSSLMLTFIGAAIMWVYRTALAPAVPNIAPFDIDTAYTQSAWRQVLIALLRMGFYGATTFFLTMLVAYPVFVLDLHGTLDVDKPGVTSRTIVAVGLLWYSWPTMSKALISILSFPLRYCQSSIVANILSYALLHVLALGVSFQTFVMAKILETDFFLYSLAMTVLPYALLCTGPQSLLRLISRGHLARGMVWYLSMLRGVSTNTKGVPAEGVPAESRHYLQSWTYDLMFGLLTYKLEVNLALSLVLDLSSLLLINIYGPEFCAKCITSLLVVALSSKIGYWLWKFVCQTYNNLSTIARDDLYLDKLELQNVQS